MRQIPHEPVEDAPARLWAVLSRPAGERLREHKYRFAQGVVFGLPVVALQWFGGRLGGDEAALWVAAFQALLAGWVIYIAATGMLIEALLLRRVTMDGVVSAVSVLLYLASVAATVLILWRSAPPLSPVFHWSVLLLIAWTGGRWWRLSRTAIPPA